MRDIYLIDFENVASEGLSGITYLSEEDQVIIFYSNNSNRLSMKMHILIGKSICNLSYFEVSVGGKNALDHQIATWLGYLIGTNAAERSYYIVSRDMGYKHVANFWATSTARAKVRCIENIRAAGRLERKLRERRENETVQVTGEETAISGLPVVQVEVETTSEENRTASQVQPEIRTEAAQTEEIQAEAAQPEEIQPEAAAEAPQTEETQALPGEEAPKEALQELQEPWAGPQADPEDVPEEPSNRRSYRGRTKFRRGKSRYQEKPTEPQKAQEAPKAPEQKEVPKAQEPQNVPEPPKAIEPQKEAAKSQDQETGEKPEISKKRSGKTQREKRPAETKTPRNLEQLSGLIAPYPSLQENTLRELILSNKRQVLCNTLRKQLGQEKGLALYNEIKKSAWH